MWVMTSFGILMPAIRPAETIAAGDERTLQIRTRRWVELEILRTEYMGDALGETIHTPRMDYNFRAYTRPADFADAVGRMIEAIDYAKFKPTTEARYGDKDLHSVYNSIWSVVARLGEPWEALADERRVAASQRVRSTQRRRAGRGVLDRGWYDLGDRVGGSGAESSGSWPTRREIASMNDDEFAEFEADAPLSDTEDTEGDDYEDYQAALRAMRDRDDQVRRGVRKNAKRAKKARRTRQVREA